MSSISNPPSNVRLRSKLRPSPEVRHFQYESDFFAAPCGEIVVDGVPVRIAETSRIPAKRLQTIFSKEPTTIPWIETFAPDDVFVDIGANIGLYSIYAGTMGGCRVFSFEPESLNFGELNKNIFVNGLSERVTGFCCAISDVSKPGILHLGAFGYSYSHHDFDENTWSEDKSFGAATTARDKRLKQGIMSSSLDDLVSSGVVEQPTHIKVDVDGLEHKVFAGMRRTLADPTLRTVLIEIDFANPQAGWMIDTMLAEGWKVSYDQLATNRKVIFARDQIDRLRTSGKGGLNYIFYRDDAYARLFADFLEGYVPPLAKAAS